MNIEDWNEFEGQEARDAIAAHNRRMRAAARAQQQQQQRGLQRRSSIGSGSRTRSGRGRLSTPIDSATPRRMAIVCLAAPRVPVMAAPPPPAPPAAPGDFLFVGDPAARLRPPPPSAAAAPGASPREVVFHRTAASSLQHDHPGSSNALESHPLPSTERGASGSAWQRAGRAVPLLFLQRPAAAAGGGANGVPSKYGGAALDPQHAPSSNGNGGAPTGRPSAAAPSRTGKSYTPFDRRVQYGSALAKIRKMRNSSAVIAGSRAAVPAAPASGAGEVDVPPDGAIGPGASAVGGVVFSDETAREDAAPQQADGEGSAAPAFASLSRWATAEDDDGSTSEDGSDNAAAPPAAEAQTGHVIGRQRVVSSAAGAGVSTTRLSSGGERRNVSPRRGSGGELLTSARSADEEGSRSGRGAAAAAGLAPPRRVSSVPRAAFSAAAATAAAAARAAAAPRLGASAIDKEFDRTAADARRLARQRRFAVLFVLISWVLLCWFTLVCASPPPRTAAAPLPRHSQLLAAYACSTLQTLHRAALSFLSHTAARCARQRPQHDTPRPPLTPP